jgi:adenylate cyclase
MERLREFFHRHFEPLFVLVVLAATALVSLFIPYKFAFLNFFYIPALLAAYYLGRRQAVLGALLIVIMVSIYAYLEPGAFLARTDQWALLAQLLTWAGFLLLATDLVGRLTERLRGESEQTRALNIELTEYKQDLEATRDQLRDHVNNLEQRVTERTEHLEKSKQAIEELKTKVEEALYASMDPRVVKMIIENRLRTEKRRVSLMFSDLEQFTTYSEERRPELVINDLNRFLEKMEQLLQNYKAHIDKYMGDGIMVEFGAPVDYERHCLLAVVAGLQMQKLVQSSQFPWNMRVGIATGEPIIGLVGHNRKSYTAIGDVVNLASRIEKLCPAGLVTVDETTYEDVARFVVAQRKTLLPQYESCDPETASEIEITQLQLNETPEDIELLKRLGALLLPFDAIQSHEFYERAMKLAPDDIEAKMGFAEAALKLSNNSDISVRGKKAKMTLFEISALVDPLLDRNKIPEPLYQDHIGTIDKLETHPEGLLLPVEAVDGCIGHSRAVGFLVYAVANALKLADLEKHDLLLAGYLADIGKGIIPHHLLNRSGSLNPEEFEEVVKHPRESVRRLKSMGYQNQFAFEAILSHHERFDGKGYPNGLKGKDIPLGGRILSLCDAYDAMTSWRPYRDSWAGSAAFLELAKETQQGKFDPRVTQTLGVLLGHIKPQVKR